MAGRDKVAAISTSTGNQPSASARFREMIEPTGTADELRVAFTDAFGMWMSLVVFTQRRMTEADLRFVSDVVPAATSALRQVTVRSLDGPAAGAGLDDGPAPSVLLLDAADRIISADAVARKRLALLPGPGGDQAPGVMSFLAARARWDRGGGPATARMRALDGRWFEIDVSVLDDAGTGNVAAVMQPAPSELVLDSVLRAMGLSAREREVAALLAQGRPTKSIAAMLAAVAVDGPGPRQGRLRQDRREPRRPRCAGRRASPRALTRRARRFSRRSRAEAVARASASDDAAAMPAVCRCPRSACIRSRRMRTYVRWSAGINRNGARDVRARHRRVSDPRWP